jgi:hypothetical protein
MNIQQIPIRTIRAFASHCQIDCQISFDNYHLNFRMQRLTKLNNCLNLTSHVNEEVKINYKSIILTISFYSGIPLLK